MVRTDDFVFGTDISNFPSTAHLTADVKLARAEVEVIPHQPEHLASAHPRAELQQEEFIEAVLLGLF